jgi:hypothetical protein
MSENTSLQHNRNIHQDKTMSNDGTGLRGLAAKWRADADKCDAADDYERGMADASRIDAAQLESALSAVAPPPVLEGSFQQRVQPWMLETFDMETCRDVRERGDRLLEETLELLQSHGYDPARVATLRDYVFGRPIGEPKQEVGGVMVTLAAYCLATDLDMHDAGEAELARIWTKVDVIRQKQASKRGLHTPLPVPPAAPAQPEMQAAPIAWQPIESAPKDGTRVLLGWDDDGSEAVAGNWSVDKYATKPCSYWTNDREHLFGKVHTRLNPPTHWQALPPPPTGE